MTSLLSDTLRQAVMITAFVAMMMLTVEYASVLSRGAFQQALSANRWLQYGAAVLLGALPGCLGPFMVVALYAHRAVSFGAVVGAMIATSGDEAFVMFSLFPGTAALLTVALAGLGFLVAPQADLLAGKERLAPCGDLVVHAPEACRCFPGREVIELWRPPSAARGVLGGASSLFWPRSRWV